MKTTILLVIGFCSATVFAGDNYQETMQKNITTVYTSKDILQLQSAINTFERIGAAEKTKWEPYYYEAFGYVMISLQAKETTVKDSYLDRADVAVKKAKELVPQESEVIAMEGFVQMMKVNVDPATRGPKDSGKVMTSLKKAVDLNGDNPRALALLAQMQFGTSKFFGSSTADACATTDKAIEKFVAFRSDNPLAPQWGKGMADDLKANCGK